MGILLERTSSFKVVVFYLIVFQVVILWKLLLDRISTKANLDIRNILPLEDLGNCVLCDSEGKIICSCAVICKVWTSIMEWLDFTFITLPNLFVHVECWSSEAPKK